MGFAPSAASPAQTTFRIPFLFIGTGLLLFIAFNLFSLLDVQLFSQANLRMPYGWSLAHLGVLGWASMIAMGAVYQLLQVVLQKKVYSERLCYIHFGVYVTGVLGIVCAFYRYNVTLLGAAAGLAAAGIALFVLNLLLTIREAKKWDSITIAVVLAISCLLLTAATGLVMGIDFAAPFLGGIHSRLLPAHIWLGAVGWFGLLIVGFSFKLLPMFLLAHDYPRKSEPWMIGLLAFGVLGMCLSLLLGLSKVAVWLCLLLMTVGFGLYGVHVQGMVKHRNKRTPGPGIHAAIWIVRGTALLLVAVTGALAVWPGLWENPQFLHGAVYLYFLVWINGSVLSYMSKIVPFLWWTHRYSSQIGKPGVPTLAQLLPEKHVSALLFSLIGLHAVNGLCLMAGLVAVPAILQWPLAVLSIVYASQLALVFRR